MLVECKKCGAPLDVRSDSARYVECGYCGKTNRVRTLKTLHAQTPDAWRPPDTWQLSGQELRYSGTEVKAASAGVIVAVVGVVLASIAGIVGTLVAIGAVSVGAATALNDEPARPAWDGAAPFACGGHEDVTISNQTANLPDLVAISVTGHCQLTIEGSSITARVPLSVSQHGNVVVRGGRLEGSPNAIEALGHASVNATNVEIVGEIVEERHASVVR